ncbi:MAG: Ig-like domain-containing protein [Candidatus Thermoplasmatota archaeon]|nr:Ig-like domain-containing protein [Candidatus Thermoplasmatota archaeon]
MIIFENYGNSSQNLQSGEWIPSKNTSFSGGLGEAVVGTGDYIYVMRSYSSGSSVFWRYPINNDWEKVKQWSDLVESDLPRPKSGTALAWDHNDYIYVMFGSAGSDINREYFYRYNITNNSWKRLTDTPHTQGAGDAITWCGYDGYVYAIMGSNWSNHDGAIFAKYNPNTNMWGNIALNPNWGDVTDDGVSLVWTGGEYLYALHGEYEETIPNGDFARYHIPAQTWEDLTSMPEVNYGGVGDGASLLWIGNWLDEYENCIFALGGGGCYPENPGYNFYCYYINNDTWEPLEDIPYPVGCWVGNRLGFANGHIYYWQGAPSTWEGEGNRFCMYKFSNTPPIADFTYSPSSPTTQNIIHFTDLSSDEDGSIVSWYWEFGDGTTSSLQNPQHQYEDDRTYCVNLTVWDNDFATNTTSKQITILKSQYTLTTSVNPSGSGYVTLNPSGGTYDEGTVATVNAHANSGYEFDHWSGAKTGSINPVQITMDSDKSITAHFVASIPPDQPPTVTITHPSNNATVSGTVSIVGTASDDISVEKVEIKIDSGNWITTTGNISWGYSWDTTTIANGNHTIYARSYDGELYSNISFITVNIFNNHKPTVDIIFPSDGTEVKKTFTIHGIADDVDGNETIQKVEIKIGDGNWTVVNGITAWNHTWNTTNVTNGDYVIQVKAYDGYEYSGIDSITVKVNNKKGDGTPGFEMIALIAALAAVLLLRKRERRKS